MKKLLLIISLALIALPLLFSECDYGSKKAFADSIRAAGHFQAKH